MIGKSRLQELINEGATIYYADRVVQYPIPIFLNEEDFVRGNELSYEENSQNGCIRDNIPLKDLYETHEEAEWHLKYHTTRTEELNLPMFDEKQDITYWFFDAKGFEILLVCVNGEVGVLRYDNKALDKELFCEPATEENYIKACDLCLKLFKGEEDENQ